MMLSGRLLVRAGAVATFVAAASGVAALVVEATHRRPAAAEAFAWAHSPGPLPKLWQAPPFSLVDQRGERFTLESLRGRPFVADFVFTECTSACPLMTSKMVQLQRELSGRSVAFVSFSVDPAHDTPEVLARYAAGWNATETRWSLLSTTPSTLTEVAAGFRVTTMANDDPENPIIHSTVFELVDGDGFVRGVYDSEDRAAMAALKSAAESLSRTAAPVPRRAPGSLYASLGCGGCHDRPAVAPPLVNLRGARRSLEGGASVTIDEAYVRRSVLDPASDRVAGYTVPMPSYRDELTDADVDALVAEVLARTSSSAGAPTTEVKVVVDPVCGMKVRAEDEAPHADYEGKRYTFCSEVCRDSFVRTPRRYTADAAP